MRRRSTAPARTTAPFWTSPTCRTTAKVIDYLRETMVGSKTNLVAATNSHQIKFEIKFETPAPLGNQQFDRYETRATMLFLVATTSRCHSGC